MFIDRFFSQDLHNPADTWFKSLLTTISWRALVSPDRIMIAWLITGNLKTAGLIMFLEIFTKMFLYYVHSRFSARRFTRNLKRYWPNHLAGTSKYNERKESGLIRGACTKLGGTDIAQSNAVER